MATTIWSPNAALVSQVDSLTIGGAPVAGNTVSGVINTKSVTYTVVTGDTTATVAAALAALLSNTSTAPPEFQEVSWTVSATSPSVILGTAVAPGTPFTLTASATGGGATITRASVTANSSNSDVANNNNWLRAGSPGIPQNGDDVIVASSNVPLLWNLTSLNAVLLNSYTRWQNFTGTIGLPENNPNGYVEYRPTYFQLASNVTTLPAILGIGTQGSGPSRERYDFQTYRVALSILAAGSPADPFSVRMLGSHVSNTLTAVGTSVGVAMLPGETATLASATVGSGASLSLGSGATFSGTLTIDQGSATLNCAPATVLAQNSASVTVVSSGLTYAAVTAKNNTRITWNSSSTITSLDLAAGSTLDKSQDVRAMTITSSAIDADTCQILDPTSAITFTNATTTRNQCGTGPITWAPGRSVKVT